MRKAAKARLLIATAIKALQAAEAALPPERSNRAKGGKARAAALTPERRREIAKKAADARWGKTKEQK